MLVSISKNFMDVWNWVKGKGGLFVCMYDVY